MFNDRKDAGRKLAEALKGYEADRPIILALPRGGVPVGFEVAVALGADLDVLVVRKIGAPWNPEFGVGAIAKGVEVFDQESLGFLGLKPEDLRPVIEREELELERRSKLYRGDNPFPDLADRVVILVDDGLATGVTTRAAIIAIKQMNPARLVLAVPVGPPETVASLRSLVDELICLETPSDFMAVGAFYLSFPQTSDEEVIELLERAKSKVKQ